ncbi:MAG: hypothetical protein ABI652_05640 [Acidobacteriota bacterium]
MGSSAIDAATLTPVLLKRIGTRWPGATLAAASVSDAQSCRDGIDRTPVIAHPDLNADGTPDVALRLQSGDEVRVVAAIARLDGVDDLYEVTVKNAEAGLGVGHPGGVYRAVGTSMDKFFGIDTLVQVACGKEGIGYFWTGAGFTESAIVTGAAPATAAPIDQTVPGIGGGAAAPPTGSEAPAK